MTAMSCSTYVSSTEELPYWTRVVNCVEEKERMNLKKVIIRNLDYASTLPDHLRRRVAEILPYEDFDQNVFDEESAVETPVSFDSYDEEDDEEREDRRKRQPREFNESTCSEIERLEHEFQRFDLVLDKPLEVIPKKKKKQNWTSSYICKPRKQRICWNSKAYDMETGLGKKTFEEQADELMDKAAQRFINWLNALGRNRDSDLTKDKLKSLFTLQDERSILASIMTEPKEVKAIPKTVADRWHLPEMALELKFERYIRNRAKNAPKKTTTVAFGRTIPVKERPWQPSGPEVPITSVFPDELLSFEKLFRGITHLRSTKALVNFYKRKPKLDRPRYLVKSGLFKEKAGGTEVAEIPLYDKLKLKY